MDSTRRPFDRSISKEPGLKKPRLTGDHVAPDRSSNIRGFIQRPVLTNSNGGSRVHMDRDSKSSDSVRGPYQHQPGNHPHQELVDRYKIALSELTFNSKPIITNLTIIAGENLHAAKAIAAIVCSNIIEVPREQKLPSLYLLDSIVKNIGKDYIKYFASRLPEVFCKAYKQVDPSIHQSMRHLFRTWKGVFPHQPLQIIEKELGFTSTANVSSLGSTSRPDSQAQRPAHGIHVNPKYLEARQRLQATRMGGSGDNITGSLVNMHEDVEAPERNIPISPAGSWGDPYNKDFDSYITKPQIIHEDIGPRFDDEALTDSIRGTQELLFLSEDQSQTEGRMLPGPDRNKSGYVEGYSRGLKSSENIAGRKPFQSHPDRTSIRGPNVKFSADVMPMPKVSVTQQETLGAASIHQRTPSPPFSLYGQNRQLNNNFAEHSLTSTGPPKDPRRPPGQRNVGSLDKFSQDLVPLASQDVYESSAQKFEPQNLQSSSTAMPPLHQRKHVPSKQQRKLEESSCDGQKLLLSQVSGSETQSIMGNSSSDQSNPLTVDSPGQSITSSLLTAAVKCGVLGNTSLMGSSAKLVCHEVGSHSFPGGVPLPNGPPANPGFTLIKSEQPPLPPGPPPTSLAGSGSEQTPNTVNSISNPVSSLLSSLVAKGLISASKSDSLLSDSAQKSNPPLDRGPGVPSASSTLDSSVPVTLQKPHLSANDEPSSSKPAANVSDGLPQTTRETKNFIGFEFRPDVVRNLHPDVVTDLLSDLPYQCSLCGLRLKLQEQFDRHKEWHALRAPEQNPLKKNSRRWYANLIDWVAGVDHFCAEDSPLELLAESGVALESSEPMVSADESQCACIFCGELFEDFYNQERDEWMFRGAVYLTLPSESHEGIGAMGDTASLSPIVHANCISEDFIQDLGLTCNVRLQKDA